MRAPAAAAVALAALLAGCTAEAPRLEGGLPGDGLGHALAGLAGAGNASEGDALLGFEAAPTWEVGQWWTYRSSNGGETRAVRADAGSAWIVGSDDAESAYFEARSDISTLGPIRKADLAGNQGGVPILYYQFPLTPNSTWSTPWDGVQRTVHVLGPQTALVGGRSYPAMALEAREGDRVAVRYDYVPAVGWYSRAEFLNADGTSFGLALTSFGRGYNGTLVEARLHPLYADQAGGPLKPAGQFDVPAGLAYLDVQWAFAGDAVAYELGFRGPDGFQTGYQVGPCSANCTLVGNATLPATPGSWGLLAGGVVHGTQTRSFASLTVTGVELRRSG